jgi:hypothetical protein
VFRSSGTCRLTRVGSSWPNKGRSSCILCWMHRESAGVTFSKSGPALRHFMARHERDFFFGLGDKTGGLNLAGRRLRTDMMDALGYDPRCAARQTVKRITTHAGLLPGGWRSVWLVSGGRKWAVCLL